MKRREVAPERKLALWWLRQSDAVLRRLGYEPRPTSVESVRQAEAVVEAFGEHLTKKLGEK